VTFMEKLLSIIEAVLQRPATVKSLSLAEMAEKHWNTVLKFCLVILVVRVVPKFSLVLAAYLAWHLAHGGGV
jgi:hypothetical protein